MAVGLKIDPILGASPVKGATYRALIDRIDEDAYHGQIVDEAGNPSTVDKNGVPLSEGWFFEESVLRALSIRSM